MIWKGKILITNIIFSTTQKTFSNTALLIKSYSGSFYIILQGWYHWICKIVRKLKFKSWEGFQTVLSHIVDNNVTVFRLNPVLVNHVIHETRKLRKLISDIYKKCSISLEVSILWYLWSKRLLWCINVR